MSFVKRMMERLEDQESVAVEIALDAGVLRKCEYHGTLMSGGTDIEAAYRLANSRFSAGQYHGDFEDGPETTDAIKKVVEDNSSDECHFCERWKDD
jgi:hypothetical protein